MYTPRRFHIFMRRTTPFEPLEPIDPAEPLSHTITGKHASRATAVPQKDVMTLSHHDVFLFHRFQYLIAGLVECILLALKA